MKSGLDEKSLVKSVLSKDRTSFEMLINQYKGLVIHIVMPLIKNEADREDICQDVFLKVYENLHTFLFKSKLSTWIGNIAFNTAINFNRKRRSVLISGALVSSINDENKVVDYESLIADDTSPADILLIKKEDKLLLEREIEKLSAIQKTILLLFHQDELKIDEISAVLEMPVNTVKSHLFRARTNLKDALLKNKF